MTQSFDLPVDVPWYLVAASPDMMDTTFNDDLGYPPAWHSSMAIYAYEPSPDDLPTELCNQTVTYLKVTCTITGYQPTQAETAAGSFGTPPYANPSPVGVEMPGSPGGSVQDVPDSDIFGDFTDAYFACYGVLLNVSVFSSVSTLPQATATEAVTFGFGDPRNPTTIPAGLSFTLFQGAAAVTPLPLFPAPGGRVFGVRIGSGSVLEIDLPFSTNVSVEYSMDGAGTITAYSFGQQVFQAALTQTKDLTIPIGGPSVTRITVAATKGTVYLIGISYSSMERAITLNDYPHIIDFEPKTRDLYQAATDQNEILTGSNSKVSAGKSLSNTSSTQMGLGLTASNSSGGSVSIDGIGGGGTTNLGAQFTSAWGNSTNDTTTTAVDSSRQARETQGSTTSITQQYNLLTGYHAGTNRAAFIMLPRPHTLQATDYRTFVRGLRMIEGVQDFFLIVSRPSALPGICIEATLETGHFPEDAPLTPVASTTPASTQQNPIPVPIYAYAPGGYISSQSSNNTPGGTPTAASLPQTYPVPAGYSLDTSQQFSLPSALPGQSHGPSGSLCPGVSCTITSPTGPGSYYQAMATAQVVVTYDGVSVVSFSVIVSSAGSWGAGAAAMFNFEIYIVPDDATPPQSSSDPADSEPYVVVSEFLVTSRDLSVCINSCSQNNCIMLAPTEQVPYSQSPGPASSTSGSTTATGSGTQPVTVSPPSSPTGVTADQVIPAKSSIVYEAKLKVPRALTHPNQLQKSRTPAARELMNNIKHHMLNNWRMPQRRPKGTVGFLESDYFCERMRKLLPKTYLSRKIGTLNGIAPAIVTALGANKTIDDVLKLDLHGLGVRAKLNAAGAANLRRLIFGFIPAAAQPDKDVARKSTPKKNAPNKAAGKAAPRKRKKK